MSTDKFIVTTVFGKSSRTEMWDASAPMGIGYPFKWVMEKSETGVRIRNLSQNADKVIRAELVHVNSKMIEEGSLIELESQGKLGIKIKPRGSMIPGFSSDFSEHRIKGHSEIYAFTGVRSSIMDCEKIYSGYVAYMKGRPLFTLEHNNTAGFRLKVLLSWVRIKEKGGKSLSMAEGEIWELSAEKLSLTTIYRNWHWWRFNLAALPQMMRDERKREDLLPGDLILPRIPVALGFLAVLIGIWMVYAPESVKMEKKVVPPQKIKLMFRKREVPKAQPTSLPKIESASVVAQLKTNAQKRSTPAPVAKSGRPAPQTVTRKPIPNAAEHAQMLREAFAGASSPIALNKPLAHPSLSKDLFSAASPSRATASAVSSFSGNNVKVELGGAHGASGSGAGYGNSGVSKVSGGGLIGLGDGVSGGGEGSLVENGLTMDEVGAVIQSHSGEVHYCQEEALLQASGHDGRLLVVFKISRSGVVISPAIQNSTLGDSTVGKCILAHLLKWKFPAPRGGGQVSVSYPFVFKILESG